MDPRPDLTVSHCNVAVIELTQEHRRLDLAFEDIARSFLPEAMADRHHFRSNTGHYFRSILHIRRQRADDRAQLATLDGPFAAGSPSADVSTEEVARANEVGRQRGA